MGNFSLELEIEVIDNLTTVLYFYPLYFFIFCSFVDVCSVICMYINFSIKTTKSSSV